jgi:hypothetical protein
MTRAVAALVVVIFAITISGCTGSSAAPGIVTGVATPCDPYGSLTGPPPVRVMATQNRGAAATVIVGTHGYRLVLRPGRYVISAPGSGRPPRTVVLFPGEHVTMNFVSRCV